MNNQAEKGYEPLEQQLAQYADDLNAALQGRDELEASHQALSKQLVSYGEDFRKVYDDLAAQLKSTKAAYIEIIHRLSLAAEFKDEDTGDHIDRMSRYSAIMAGALGFSSDKVQSILNAAPMHDVGKIGIPDRILLKPGRLTEDEFKEMRKHANYGARILEGSDAEIIQLAQTIALTHHEKWNGMGYPRRLKGEDIPLVGRIVNLADMFDALTSRRPYKDPYPVEVAVQIIKKERGESLDPQVVDAFLSSLDTILAARDEISPEAHAVSHLFTLSERDLVDGTQVESSQLKDANDA